jgi:hypothetical protein
MYEAFPRSDYYGPSAPPHGHRLTMRQPEPAALAERGASGASRWFPRSLQTDRQVRRPAMPLRYRHGYAAGFHRGLRRERPKPTPKFPTPKVLLRIADQPESTGLELAGDLRGVRTLVPLVRLPALLAGPGPSGSTGPSRRCRGCLPPSPTSLGSGCPQLRYAAATAQRRRSSTSARLRSASWRTRSPSLRC